MKTRGVGALRPARRGAIDRSTARPIDRPARLSIDRRRCFERDARGRLRVEAVGARARSGRGSRRGSAPARSGAIDRARVRESVVVAFDRRGGGVGGVSRRKDAGADGGSGSRRRHSSSVERRERWRRGRCRAPRVGRRCPFAMPWMRTKKSSRRLRHCSRERRRADRVFARRTPCPRRRA